jgi:hypothetical protein
VEAGAPETAAKVKVVAAATVLATRGAPAEMPAAMVEMEARAAEATGTEATAAVATAGTAEEGTEAITAAMEEATGAEVTGNSPSACAAAA